jgi:hypothetical protein
LTWGPPGVAGHMSRPTSDALLPVASSKAHPPLVVAPKSPRYPKAPTFVALEIAARSPAPLVPSHIRPHTDRPTNHSAIASPSRASQPPTSTTFPSHTARDASRCVSSKSSKKKSTSCPTASSTGANPDAGHPTSHKPNAATRALRSTTPPANHFPMPHARQPPMRCLHLHHSRSQHPSPSPSSSSLRQLPCLFPRRLPVITATLPRLRRAITVAHTTSRSVRALP